MCESNITYLKFKKEWGKALEKSLKALIVKKE